MLTMVLTASILLLGVGLLSTSWATPSQSDSATVPTRTPAPITMTLAVNLQRPNAPAPNASWSVPVELAFYEPGDPVTKTVVQRVVTLTEGGRWTGALNVRPDTYDVRVKNLHTLRNVKHNVSAAEGATIDMGTLHEGDANGDNRVRAADFAILRAAYFTSKGGNTGNGRTFDPRADFDEDGRIRASDFALLRSNYFKTGDLTVHPTMTQAMLALPQGSVALAIEPAHVAVESAETFTLTVVAHAEGQPFVALDVEIRFPATQLQIIQADGTPATQVEPASAQYVLYNHVDNAQGTINYSAGILGDPASGDMDVARLRFKVVRDAATMPIDFGEVLISDPSGAWVTGRLSGAIALMTKLRRPLYLPVIYTASR